MSSPSVHHRRRQRARAPRISAEAGPPEGGSSGESLLNRELSWLAYNGRVLELAGDPEPPLLGRVRLCRFFSSNLDEFFMVRVAGLLGQVAAGLGTKSPDGRTAESTLAEIRGRVIELVSRQSSLWKTDLHPALATAGIVVAGMGECDEREATELEGLFERQVYPVLTPLGVGPGQPFPYISGLSLSLAVLVREPETGEERFARVKVPELLPRFLPVGARGLHIPLERVIRHFLPWLFPKMEIVECCVFRVTRDADFEISDEADDLLEAVEYEVRRRRFGDVVRLEVSSSVSTGLLERLKRGLGVGDDQIYAVEGPLNLADLAALDGLERPDLDHKPWYGVTHPRFSSIRTHDGLFAEIRRSDVLVQQPYDSFATSFEAFVDAAADDPDVAGLKTTVYRTSEDSPLVPALIRAAESGKQSLCLVELKARFDERRNIEWSRALEEAGVHVVYGFPNVKIHAKLTLVVRREGDSLRRYVHVGTGNYHSLTARLYEDFGLFTDDEGITADVADLFNYLTGFGRPQGYRKILVAPFHLRSALIERVRATAHAAEAGRRARIRLKVNNITDPAVIAELYGASQRGVEVEVVARSVCALRPGVPGLSENVRVRSVLGRFLEHSRLFLFETDDDMSFFLGSADLMPRNLDHRIEILVPIEDAQAQRDLTRTFDVLMADNVDAWDLDADGDWRRARPDKGERSRAAQSLLARRAALRARRSGLRRAPSANVR